MKQNDTFMRNHEIAFLNARVGFPMKENGNVIQQLLKGTFQKGFIQSWTL
jgi:hypothetical protein